ncbi:MAG: hypothetical protein CSB44_03025 [Gammaproteobacteria bacterium]|nr:MAG: hypothetical protein CSB44_03025 [Gammaproteobacteria bacterium]
MAVRWLARAMRWFVRAIGIAATAAVVGCASSGSLDTARDQFLHGSHDEALRTLSEADVAQRDQLLLYLERGLIAQAAGDYDQSIDAFARADEIIDELDYLSVGDTGSALLVNDSLSRYRGEYAERLWLNTHQMMNFLLAGRPEGAAVEARRALPLFKKHGDVLDADVFTRALMALSFEAAGQYDSAGVEWRRLRKQQGKTPAQGGDASANIASTAGSNGGNTRSPDDAELILFIRTGLIPRKISSHLLVGATDQIAFPGYIKTYDTTPRVSIHEPDTGNDSLPIDLWQSDFAALARASLDKRGAAIVARQAARVALKHEIGNQIAGEDEVAGDIARLLLFILERADTRSWRTLPGAMTLVRLRLPPGDHELLLELEGHGIAVGGYWQLPISTRLESGERRYLLVGPNLPQPGHDVVEVDHSL